MPGTWRLGLKHQATEECRLLSVVHYLGFLYLLGGGTATVAGPSYINHQHLLRKCHTDKPVRLSDGERVPPPR